MDLYADDLADYIYQENDVDKKRALLLKVEAEIKKLMGEQEKGSLDLRHIGAVQIEKIQDLIGTRSLILNQMFQATSQEIKRFEAVNELLNSLTKKMYHRMANLYRTLINSPKDESFDDDYIIRGTTEVCVLWGGVYIGIAGRQLLWLRFCLHDRTNLLLFT